MALLLLCFKDELGYCSFLVAVQLFKCPSKNALFVAYNPKNHPFEQGFPLNSKNQVKPRAGFDAFSRMPQSQSCGAYVVDANSLLQLFDAAEQAVITDSETMTPLGSAVRALCGKRDVKRGIGGSVRCIRLRGGRRCGSCGTGRGFTRQINGVFARRVLLFGRPRRAGAGFVFAWMKFSQQFLYVHGKIVG
ncbi:hypothetical protein SAMN02745704_01267 [Paucidesulfovibrio gracilis DSM 16080]|uniref:Uncharacterized protein n=1 Tax=Paucidesulfovibrio gracilis DSM 16080 TaxID=1121449 RepID=A0A1T4WRV0_9BACT|nr:hypothetical protein SAMN02745704_01267 [Paucidesulfovibrio gracilis DSM 16080]